MVLLLLLIFLVCCFRGLPLFAAAGASCACRASSVQLYRCNVRISTREEVGGVVVVIRCVVCRVCVYLLVVSFEQGSGSVGVWECGSVGVWLCFESGEW